MVEVAKGPFWRIHTCNPQQFLIAVHCFGAMGQNGRWKNKWNNVRGPFYNITQIKTSIAALQVVSFREKKFVSFWGVLFLLKYRLISTDHKV